MPGVGARSIVMIVVIVIVVVIIVIVVVAVVVVVIVFLASAGFLRGTGDRRLALAPLFTPFPLWSRIETSPGG